MNTLLQDLRFGLRMLARNPGFTTVALLTLALGIGANTLIFSLVNAALLRSLPYRQPDRLVYVWSAEAARGINQSTVSIPDLRDWREQNQVFEEMAGWFSEDYNLSGGDHPQQVGGWVVSPNFFAVLGASAEIGRTLGPGENRGGNGLVVVLSHALWMGAFGGDPKILGSEIQIDGVPHAVIGVMPAEFSSPFPKVQIWVPWPDRLEPTAARGDRFLRVIARLKPGVSIERAQAGMNTITPRLAQEYKEDAGVTAYLVPAEKQITGSIRPALLVLLGAVGFVLLIGCANLANLLLARSAGREKEFAVRVALGAGHLDLMRQLLTESVLLSLLGGGIAIAGASWGTQFLRKMVADQIPRAQDVRLDGYVLLFMLGITVLTGIAFGLVPALAALRGNFHEGMKRSSRGGGQGVRTRRLRDWLVVSETALALVLLAGAALLITSFRRLRAVDPGFNTEKVLTCQISLPSTYQDPQILEFFRQLMDRIRALPGVKAAGATMTLPLARTGHGFWGGLNVEGVAAVTRESVPIVSFAQITPGYFRAMGIPLLRGRDFTSQDNSEQSPKVVIINATLARRYLSDADPIGRSICMGEDCSKGPWLTVVGVVGDAVLENLTDPRFPQVFSPHAQGVEGGPAGNMELAVRASSDPLSLAAMVREQVRQLDKNQSVADMQTLKQVVSASLAQPRLNSLLLGAFAALALLLAAIGVYGVISYSVAQRTRKIGIRLALGAARRDVLWFTVAQGLRPVAIGVVLGILSALGLARFLSGLLYGIAPADPPTLGGVASLLVLVALAACYLPARRAARVDPLTALRYE